MGRQRERASAGEAESGISREGGVAEGGVRDGGQIYRRVFESNPMPMWIRDVATNRYLDVNEAAIRQYGYTREEFLRLRSHDLVPQQDLAEWEAYLERTGPRGEHRRQGRHRRKDGSIIEVEVTSHQFDYEGRPARLSLVNDITEKKRAHQALRDSEARLSAIIQSEPECVKVVDPNGELLEMNPAGLAMLEAESIEQVREHGLLEFIVAEHRQAFLNLHGRVMRGESGELEFEVTGLKGTRRRLDTHAVPLRGDDGEVTALLGITRDVTERRRMEEKLRESEERYRYLFEANPMPMWVRDAQTNGFIAVNDAAVRLYGYSREEFSRINGFDIHAEQEHGAYREFLQRRDRQQNTVQRWRHRKKDGTLIDVEVYSHNFDNDGRPARLALVNDVTGKRLIEEEIRKLNTELERRVIERTRQLEVANQELEAFAYSVSHDLRAPLRSIEGFSQALQEECGHLFGDAGKDYMRRVRGAAQRMGDLVDDLLALSRVSRVAVQVAEVDLSSQAREIADELRRQEPGRNVTVEIEPAMKARADPNLLAIVMQNLLHNAWKFTAKRAAATIAVGSTRRDGRPVYYVRDNGIGFDMAYAGKLFAPFQRFHAEAEFPGTGIGLATVQRVIRRHGGEIWAEAAMERGATFYFTLAG